jgi:hypothetical protein
MKIKETIVSLTLSVDYVSISALLCWNISPYLCLPPLVRSVDFSIQAFRWSIAVESTQRSINDILGLAWLPHQPSNAFEDVSTPVFDWAGVIVIPSHILESV